MIGLLALSSANKKITVSYTDCRFLGTSRRFVEYWFRKTVVHPSSKSNSRGLSENYSDTPKRRNLLAQRQRHIVADLNVLQLCCQNLQSCKKNNHPLMLVYCVDTVVACRSSEGVSTSSGSGLECQVRGPSCIKSFFCH